MEAAATIVVALVMFGIYFFATGGKKYIGLFITFVIFVVLWLLMVGCSSMSKQMYSDKPECVSFVAFKHYQSKICSPDEPLKRTGWIPDGEYERWYKATDCVVRYDYLCRKDRALIDKKTEEDKKIYKLKEDK